MTITTIGIDIAKSVFQLHGIDETGEVSLQRKLRRGAVLDCLGKFEPCLIGIEACATAHHWAREISALGHDVKLIPPAYVKPYVKRQKNDAADAEAICEAVARPNMTFVPIKTEDQQSVLVLHRARDLLMRQRTMLLNAIRAHFAEFGQIAPQGPRQVIGMISGLRGGRCAINLPPAAQAGILALACQLDHLSDEINAIEHSLLEWHRNNQTSQRLHTIPGVGLITATAMAASVPDPSQFKSARHFAAWLGLVPRQNSSGGKERLGRVSKMGNGYLRRLLVVGATSVTRHASKMQTRTGAWVRSLLEHKPPRLVTVAIANKTARVAWALMTRNEDYQPRPIAGSGAV